MKYYILLFGLIFLAPSLFSQENIDIDVDSWLSDHQEVRASIVWINRGNSISYIDWPSTLKDDLQTAVHGFMNNQYPWGLTGVPNVTLFGSSYYGVSETNAWLYYVSFVAQSITSEIKRLIPWSLNELSSTSLSVLFDSREMLTYNTNFSAYQFKYVTPAPPDYILKFLENNALIGSTRIETISRVNEWCKNLTHYYYMQGDDENAAYYATWQYHGEPPVNRIIEGTIRTPGASVLRHYTRGCHGTVQFIRTLLQTLNIPTKYERIEGHAIPHFVHEDLYMSHGDDPYGRCTKCNDVVIPAEELLFGDSEYQSHFGNQLSSEERSKNVGFKPHMLEVKYLPMCLLNLRCEANALGYDNQQCLTYISDYNGLDNEYTLVELNNLNFWNRLDNKISSYGGCGNNDNFTNYCSSISTPSSEKSIISFRFFGQYGTSVINESTRTISVQIIGSYDIRYVIPHFCLSEKAKINYVSGSYVNFSSPVTFQVTAENKTQNTWTINLTQVYPNLMTLAEFNTLNITGTAINLSIRVGNGGNVPVSDSYVAYYLSPDATISKSDYKIGEDYVPSLTAHWYSEQSLIVDVSSLSPSPQPGSYYVGFIMDYKNSVDESNENDNIYYWISPKVIVSSPSVSVTSPNGGENWQVGSSQNITWTSTGLNGYVRIEYSIDNGSNFTTLIASTPDDGSYTWTIPNLPSTICLVRVCDTDGNPVDQSNGTFIIRECNPPAQPGAITGQTSVCLGSSQTYSISSVSGATSYTWLLPSGWSGNSSTTSINATAGSSGSTISVTANNSCGSSTPRTLSVSVTATPAQPSAISGSTSVCQGSSQPYSISPVSGATSYTWLLPSGWSGNSSTTSINATAGPSGGTISVTANNTCGSSTTRTFGVLVTTIPAQPGIISGQTSVDKGSSYTYSISSVSGATSYTWTLPTGWNGASTTTSIIANAGEGALSGNISVVAKNICGQSSPSTLNVTVNDCDPPAQPGAIIGSTSVCQGSSQTYSISSVSEATSYSWTLPSGWSGSSTSTSITATAGASGGTISVTANNTCGSSTASTLGVLVTTIPAQPGIISGQTPVDKGSSYTYSISSVSGATSYTWTLPTGWTGASTTTSIIANAVVSALSGNISVVANNTCGQSSPSTLNVTVNGCNPPAQPGIISGQTPVDKGSSYTYSISTVSGATSYTWTLPTGWTGTSTTSSMITTIGEGALGGNISVVANNTCGQSSPSTLIVTVNICNLPAQPNVITGQTTVCQGSSQTYSISAVSEATSYIWTLPFGWSGSSTSTSITATAGAGGGTISVIANNSCGSGILRTLSVSGSEIPTPIVIIDGDKLTSSSSLGNQWYKRVASDFQPIPGAMQQSFVPNENGSYCVKVTINNCESSLSNLIDFTFGIEKNELFKGISIYPNPSHNILIIENDNSLGPIDFEILNFNGKKISNSILNNRSVVDLTSFSSGIYYIRFTEGASYYILKFIKE